MGKTMYVKPLVSLPGLRKGEADWFRNMERVPTVCQILSREILAGNKMMSRTSYDACPPAAYALVGEREASIEKKKITPQKRLRLKCKSVPATYRKGRRNM